MSNSEARQAERGLLFVVSAPSGTGKTTLVDRLVRSLPNLHKSRSYTSRPRRPGERDSVDYNFVSRAQFNVMIQDGVFLEWADVFGNYYGTSATDTEAVLADGGDVVLVIDVQGARQVRSQKPDALGVFVLPPSVSILSQRLRDRSKDTEDEIAKRLKTASYEVGEFAQYEYVVVNDELEDAVSRLGAIVMAERARVQRMRDKVEAIVRVFRNG